jgi:hypothetical protein
MGFARIMSMGIGKHIATVFGGVLGPVVGVLLVFGLLVILDFVGLGNTNFVLGMLVLSPFLAILGALVGFAGGVVVGARLDDRRISRSTRR